MFCVTSLTWYVEVTRTGIRLITTCEVELKSQSTVKWCNIIVRICTSTVKLKTNMVCIKSQLTIYTFPFSPTDTWNIFILMNAQRRNCRLQLNYKLQLTETGVTVADRLVHSCLKLYLQMARMSITAPVQRQRRPHSQGTAALLESLTGRVQAPLHQTMM